MFSYSINGQIIFSATSLRFLSLLLIFLSLLCFVIYRRLCASTRLRSKKFIFAHFERLLMPSLRFYCSILFAWWFFVCFFSFLLSDPFQTNIIAFLCIYFVEPRAHSFALTVHFCLSLSILIFTQAIYASFELSLPQLCFSQRLTSCPIHFSSKKPFKILFTSTILTLLAFSLLSLALSYYAVETEMKQCVK